MLYPKSQEPNLTKELFQNPGSEYRGAPFWAWNCQLDKDELLWQLEVLKKMGMGGAHMHVRTGMATPYLSEEHMDLIKACIEKCRREHMLAWLYDEDRWPSGAAGGIVTKDPRFRARHLLLTTKPYSADSGLLTTDHCSGQGGRSNSGTLLCCYDIVLDANGCLQSYQRIPEEQQAKGVKWYAYLEVAAPNPWYNNETYVDTLNPDAIAKFIEVTYETYQNTCGADFGGIVPAIFTDEPQFTHKRTLQFAKDETDILLPWTDNLPETYKAACGLDLLELLPQILWELPDGQVSQARYYYHDHVCQRFADAFANQCGSWCDAHGLMLTGHMMNEGNLRTQTNALGEAMRSYRAFALPGIDMLCNYREYNTAKQCQSAVHQYGREGMLSELYGVTGWDFDFRGHKFQGDWQAALGVTVRVPHLSWVSMKGEAKRDYPASIHYQSPWWQDYAFVEDHFARVNAAMTRGKPLVRLAVIHPIESYWLRFGCNEHTLNEREEMDRRFEDLTQWLLFGGIDFDFISESLLPELCQNPSAPLQVGEMSYDAVLVPPCLTLRTTTLERLEAFAAAGGKLIFAGEAPLYENAVASQRGRLLWQKATGVPFGRFEILSALESIRMVDFRLTSGARTENLLHQLRADGNDRWLFVARGILPATYDISNKRSVRITLAGEYHVRKYDTIKGTITPLASTRALGKTHVLVEMDTLDSLLLQFTPDAVEIPTTVKAAPTKLLPVDTMVSYELDEPNVLLLDKAEFALDNETYRPAQELLRADNVLREELRWPLRKAAVAQPWAIPEQQPEHTVRLRFTITSQVEVAAVKLALEDAPIAKILFNGVPVTAKPDGWFTDKSIETVPLGSLPAGISTIEVELPFGKRTNVEWCYLLGNFGVQIMGEQRIIQPLPEKLGFDDVVHQGLPHYGGNITYLVPVHTHGGDLQVQIPHYRGAATKVELAGEKEYIVYPPYVCNLSDVPEGDHTLRVTLLGHRFNCFGCVHNGNPAVTWLGPNSWRSENSHWTESYRLKPLGILSAPRIAEESNEA